MFRIDSDKYRSCVFKFRCRFARSCRSSSSTRCGARHGTCTESGTVSTGGTSARSLQSQTFTTKSFHVFRHTPLATDCVSKYTPIMYQDIPWHTPAAIKLLLYVKTCVQTPASCLPCLHLLIVPCINTCTLHYPLLLYVNMYLQTTSSLPVT